MKNQYILAHGLGTSGNKATLYGLDGGLMASCISEYLTHYPGEGCVEQDAGDWWKAVCGGVGIGAFPDFSVADKFVRKTDIIEPNRDNAAAYRQMYSVFREAYERLKPIYKELADISCGRDGNDACI